MSKQRGFSIAELLVAIGIGSLATAGALIGIVRVNTMQSEAMRQAAIDTGWTELMAIAQKPRELARVLGPATRGLANCLSGQGKDCYRYNRSNFEMVELVAKGIAPFFGRRTTCNSMVELCPYERKMEKAVICAGNTACTMLLQLSIEDYTPVIRKKGNPRNVRKWKFAVANPYVPNTLVDFNRCRTGRPTGLNFIDLLPECEKLPAITCGEDMSVVGMAKGTCGDQDPKLKAQANCEFKLEENILTYRAKKISDTRFWYVCTSSEEAEFTDDASRIVYNAGAVSHAGDHRGTVQILSVGEFNRL